MQRIAKEFQSCPQVPQSSACPSSQEIATCLSAQANPQTFARVVEHCASCPACAEDWRVARALSQSLQAPPSASLVHSESEASSQVSNLYPLSVSQHAANDTPNDPWWKRSKLRTNAGLCAVACVLALLVFRSNQREGSQEIFRGDDSPHTPDERFRFQNGVFSWPDFEPGAEYQVTVFRDSGVPVLELELTNKNSQSLTASARRMIEAQRAAYWQVRTVHGSGRVSPVILMAH